MKTNKPVSNSGKTRINRGKQKHESWTKIRDKEKHSHDKPKPPPLSITPSVPGA